MLDMLPSEAIAVVNGVATVSRGAGGDFWMRRLRNSLFCNGLLPRNGSTRRDIRTNAETKPPSRARIARSCRAAAEAISVRFTALGGSRGHRTAKQVPQQFGIHRLGHVRG